MKFLSKGILIIISIVLIKLFFIENKQFSKSQVEDKDTYWISTIELY
ncbi:hypothetical protein M4L38_13785 [Staphylococcus equorum]|nr:hypothetical protein [Staphylococcus equorum]MDG0823798.1 hypothetical protein [Staphylococcus equorum]